MTGGNIQAKQMDTVRTEIALNPKDGRKRTLVPKHSSKLRKQSVCNLHSVVTCLFGGGSQKQEVWL